MKNEADSKIANGKQINKENNTYNLIFSSRIKDWLDFFVHCLEKRDRDRRSKIRWRSCASESDNESDYLKILRNMDSHGRVDRQ